MSSNVMVGFSDADCAALAEIVAEIETTQRAIAAAHVAQTRALARAGDLARKQSARSVARVREHDMALRAIAAEVAGVMRASDRSVQRQIGDASELVDDYPETLAAWQRGDITRGHVRVVTDTGAVLPPQQRADFDAAAARACTHDTAGRVRSTLELLAERLHPRTLTERHEDARRRRQVRVIALPDGMSDLSATMPTLLADAIYDRLTQQARGIVDTRTAALADARRRPETDTDTDAGRHTEVLASDMRTMDEIRTDILADILLTAAPDADPTRHDDGPGTLGAIRAKVQVVVPVLSLLGAGTDPADLAGRSPIDPATARQLAGATRGPWDRILTHPITGALLGVDTYARTTAIDRHVRARDQHCRFPGCRIPAIRCDVDHTVDHALGGSTHVRNLAHLCRRHHSVKHHSPWRVRQLGDGILEWTSPLGRVYTDHPPTPGVRFRPDVDDPSDSPPRHRDAPVDVGAPTRHDAPF